MKNVNLAVYHPIRVVSNGAVKGDKWGVIVCNKSGVVLHAGQLPYIKRVAKSKYNTLVIY